MNVVTYEAIVENGRIHLLAGVVLPEKTMVYVVVPGVAAPAVARIYSPRLAHPEEAAEFLKMEVSPEGDDAGP